MSLFSKIGPMIGQAARAYRHRRALLQTERVIGSLPAEIRKDIGWPEPGRTRINSVGEWTAW